jgi:hypothetical protein
MYSKLSHVTMSSHNHGGIATDPPGACLPWRAGKSGTRERNAKVAGLAFFGLPVTEFLENPDVNEGCAHGPLRSARGSRPGVRVRRVGRHVEA